MGAVHTYFSTDTPSGTTNLVDLKLWKYNKKLYILFFTMKPKFLSWHCDDRLKCCGSWQVSVLQPSYLKAADVPYIRPQGPHSFQGPPFFFLPPNILKSGLVYYPDCCICIMTVLLFSICCICCDMPKWWELLMANWNRGNKNKIPILCS